MYKKTSNGIIALLSLLLLLSGGCQTASSKKQPYTGSLRQAILDQGALRIIVPTREIDATTQQAIHDRVRQVCAQRTLDPNCIITDEAALHMDLRHVNLIVYGTLQGNRWLAQHVQELPFKITSDSMTAARFHSGPQLCLLTTWPHPFSKKHSLIIYTAPQAQTLAHSIPLTQEASDYQISRGTYILEAHRFIKGKEGWTLPTWHLTVPQAMNDLDFYFKTIESVHPNHLTVWEKDTYAQYKALCRARTKHVENEEGVIPAASFFNVLAQAGASFQDGHTSLTPSDTLVDASDLDPRMLPFHLAFHEGDFWIGSTLPALDHLEGQKVVAINEHDPATLLQSILTMISGERRAFRITRFIQHQRTYWALFSPIAEPLISLTLQDVTGQNQTYAIDLISVVDYDLTIARRDIRRPPHRETTYHEGRTAYWQSNQCRFNEAEMEAMDKRFSTLQTEAVQNLILDLRFNGGGNSSACERLIEYLTGNPFMIFSRVDVKVSPEYVKLRGAHHGKKVQVVTIPISPSQHAQRDNRFRGDLFVLIGESTFSTAADLASVLKDYQLGTLIGQETGGLRQCYGDLLNFHLPHSGFSFNVSCKCFYPPMPLPDDDKRGTVPDIEVSTEQLGEYQTEADPLLAFVLETISKRPSPPANAAVPTQ